MTMIADTREIQKLDLAIEVLRSSGAIRIQALGTSMLPSIWPGDILNIVSKPEKEIVPGDIVLVARQHRFVIHRLIEKQDSQWIMRGDSLSQNDDPASGVQVLGRVSAIHRNGGTVSPNPRLSTRVRVLAWLFCYCDWFRNVTVRIHSSWQRRVRRKFPTQSRSNAQVAPDTSTGQVRTG